jgi:hypothetical protein
MAVTFACPKGDQSEDPDYCSVCGIKIGEGLAAEASAASSERCPSCGIERTPGTRFCETCRYDFKARPATASAAPAGIMAAPAHQGASTLAGGADPSAATTTATSSSALDSSVATEPVAATNTSTASTNVARYWEAAVSTDCSLDVEPDPATPCPVDAPDRTFPLDLTENLIGRRSAARGILPSISLSDPGVSHRHLMVYRDPDGSLTVSDVGSTNGSFLNGSSDRLEPGVKTPVADGDSIEVGRWTRITFHCTS